MPVAASSPRRALAEFVVEGMPTVIPFHRAVVADPAYAPADPAQPFTISTRWIETEFDNTIPAWDGTGAVDAPDAAESARETLVVEVGGKRLEVSLPAGFGGGGGGGSASAGAPKRAPKRASSGKAKSAASGDALTSPMQGTIVKIAVAEGAVVAEGDVVVVLEAMKMEQPITAHKAGTVTSLAAEVGQTVTSGAVICELKD